MKTIKKLFLTILVLLISFSFVKLNAEGEKRQATVGASTYYEGELVEENHLAAGIIHQKYASFSQCTLTGFNAAGSGGGGLNDPDKLYEQSVNLLFIPATKNARIVNWVTSKNYGWCRGTVEGTAKDYEYTHPGWKVVAAINADFFDISSEKALPETTTGSCLVDGELFKSVGNTVVGFTNNGTSSTMIGDKTLQISEKFYLAIYDEDGNEVEEFEIDNVNPSSNVEGTSLYYTYPVLATAETGVNAPRNYVESTMPAGGYLVDRAERCIPYNESSFYGAGQYIKTSEDTTIITQRFGVYSTNADVVAALNNGEKITVQRKVIGDYEECESITGCGNTLIRNGEPVVTNDKNKHPRTMVGVKADGTLVFCTIDGRQPADKMYGMTMDELAAVMYSYGCVQAYNLDGGGSTTMLIKEDGKFRVLNSPSDGSARPDANSLLVVVPEIDLKVTNATDTSFELNAPNKIKGFDVSNVKVTVNGKTYDLNDKITIDGLKANSTYTVKYEYDRVYNGDSAHIIADEFTVKTGKTSPTMDSFAFRLEDGVLTVNYKFNDPDNAITSAKVYYPGGSKTLDLTKDTIEIATSKQVKAEDITITVFADIDSETDFSKTFEFTNPRLIEPTTDPSPTKKGCMSGCYIIMMASLLGAILIIKKNK